MRITISGGGLVSREINVNSRRPLIPIVPGLALMITFVCNLMLVVFLMQSAPRTDTENPVFGVIEGLWKISDQKLLVISEGTPINSSTSGLYVLFTDKAVFTFSKQADRFYFATIDRIYARDESKDGYVLLTRNHSNERRARTRLKVLNDSRKLDFFSRWSVDQTGFEMRMTLYKIAFKRGYGDHRENTG
jgi:hypothetical protein